MSLYLVLLQTGFTMPSNVATDAVRSYRTLSPLPAAGSIAATRYVGGLLSAALSVGSRPPGVTWRLVLWSPDFPPLAKPLAWLTGSDDLANSEADGITDLAVQGPDRRLVFALPRITLLHSGQQS